MNIIYKPEKHNIVALWLSRAIMVSVIEEDGGGIEDPGKVEEEESLNDERPLEMKE